MKKIYIILLSIVSIRLCALSTWHLPDPHLNYNHVAFLTTHNSYAAKKHGFFYAQQYWTIQEQLENGVRGLMLDTYYNKTKTDVVLCHGGLGWNNFLRGGKVPMSLQESLIIIKEFLERNKQEVITLFLENYVENKNLLDKAFRASDIEHLILSPADWNPLQQRGWPTIAWMQHMNKRLVIFNSLDKTDLTFNEWEHVVENQFGVLTTKHACRERKESQQWRGNNRYVYLVNYFSTFKLNLGGAYRIINGVNLDRLMQEISQGLDQTRLYKKRSPNFIAVDYVNEGDAMKHVNAINKQAKHALIRKTMFACLRVKKRKVNQHEST